MGFENVPPLPNGRFVDIANMIGRYEVLNSLEKTAEVSQQVYRRESDIVQAFYKAAGLVNLGKGIFNAAKSLGPTASRVAKAAKGVSKAATPALENAGNMAMGAVRANPMTSAALGTGAAAYGLHKLTQPAAPRLMKYAAEAFVQGGVDLVRAVNIRADLSGVRDTLEKLGAIGELNAKLQIAIDSDELTDAAKCQAVKLGSENSRLCLETLQELVKYAEGKVSVGKAASGAGISKLDQGARNIANKMESGVRSLFGQPSGGSRAADSVAGSRTHAGGNTDMPGSGNMGATYSKPPEIKNIDGGLGKSPPAQTLGGGGSMAGGGRGAAGGEMKIIGGKSFDISTAAGRKAAHAAASAPSAATGLNSGRTAHPKGGMDGALDHLDDIIDAAGGH
jgi:hypothetical protein